MKRILIISLLICSLLFTACSNTSIGIIGGADGPTSIYVSGNGKKDGTGKTIHNSLPNDEWGITLYADDLTPNGMTLKIEQFGDGVFGEFSMGEAYSLETTVNDKWQEVKTKSGEPTVWAMIAYIIKKNDITEHKINWENIYGALKPGFYRLKKEIGLSAAGNYENKTYEVYFTID